MRAHRTGVNPAEFRDAKTMDYSMMGWNEEGIPARTTLNELGMA